MREFKIINGMGCCSLCPTPINGKCASINYSLICNDCLEGLLSLTPQLLPDDNHNVVRECSPCGEKFDNIGKFLAHRRLVHK